MTSLMTPRPHVAPAPVGDPTDSGMRAARLQADGAFAWETIERPAPPPDGALLRVLGCGLCGSDLDKWRRRKAPVGAVLGHEVVGIIEALGPQAKTSFRAGDRVACAHHAPCQRCHDCLNGAESMCAQFKRSNFVPGGFAQWLSLSADHMRLTTFAVPDDVSDAEASCVEPLACALRAIRRGGETSGGRVAVIGLGFIGLMAAQRYRQLGYRVEGYDRNAARVSLGLSRGWLDTGVTVAADSGLAPTSPQTPVDRVFLSVVTPETIALSLSRVRDGGAILLFASPAQAGPVFDPMTLYFREISIIPSYSPALQDLREAADLLFSRRFDVGPLCDQRLPMARLAQAMAMYQRGEAIKILLTPSGELPGSDLPDSEEPCR